MKSKVLISLLLALVMLFTLATPALAGKPVKDDRFEEEYGTVPDPYSQVKVTMQATHDNHLKVTIVLKGAQPGSTYEVQVTGGGVLDNPTFEINDRGVGRFTGITSNAYPSGNWTVRAYLLRGLGTLRFATYYLPITFK
jgi:hypothetical protein